MTCCKRTTSTLFILLSLTACSHTPFAERLQQPLPLPSGQWQQSQLHPQGMTRVTEMRWQEVQGDGVVKSFVFEQQPNADLFATKRIDDAQGQANCDAFFDSKVLDQQPQNGYPQLTWVSDCQTQSGLYSKVLHKVIAGHESLYVFNRLWRHEPLQLEWDLWLEYSKKIHVCHQDKNPKCS